jgi:trimeric autotransporter adhesin
MLLSFRQGIVQHEPSGFLTVSPTFVSLVAIDTPTIVTLASGSKDYLHVERESVNQAWGPITSGVDQWLYWDISTSTGVRTFGITLVDPVFGPDEPTTPQSDLHWFDTAAGMMKVWNGLRWVERVRVFACKLANGSVPISMSPLAPVFTGSQVGLNTSSYAGQLMFDSISGKVLKTGTKFVTTEDVLSVQALTKSDVKFASVVVAAESQQTLTAYTVVKFSDFGKIVHADAFVANQALPFGIIQQPCLPGDTISVLVDGAVTNPSWDWSAVGINALLYTNANGELTPTRQIPDQMPVAMVIDTNTILLGAPKTINTGDTIINTAPSSIDELSDVDITTPVADQVLTFDGSQWVNAALPPIPDPVVTLDGLTDVTLTTPTADQFLKYNGSQWINSAVPTPISSLDGLSDVTLTTPVNGHVLTYTGTVWENTPIALPQADRITSTDTSLIVNGVSDSCTFVVGDITPVVVTPTAATFTTGMSGAWSTSIMEGPDQAVSETWGASVVHDYAGNIITVGGIALQATNEDCMVVAKYTPSGILLWSKQIVRTGFDTPGETVAVDLDNNIYIGTGGTDSSVFKLSSTGAILWQVELTMGAQSNYIIGLTVKQNGNPVLMMLTSGWGVPVLELDATTGAQVWLFSAYDNGLPYEDGGQLSTDGTNTYFTLRLNGTTASRVVKLSNTGTHVWSTTVDFSPGLYLYGCLVDSGYVYAAGSNTTGVGVDARNQLVVIKLDATTGDKVWAYTYTAPATHFVYGEHIATDPSTPGVIYIAGSASVTTTDNRLVCAINTTTGDVTWSVSLDIAGHNNYSWYYYGRDVVSANAGNVVTVGYSVLPSSYDYWNITSIPASSPTFVVGTSSSQTLALTRDVLTNVVQAGAITDPYVGGQYGGLVHAPYGTYVTTDNPTTINNNAVFDTTLDYLVDVTGSVAVTGDIVLAGNVGTDGQVITSTPAGARWSTVNATSMVKTVPGTYSITMDATAWPNTTDSCLSPTSSGVRNIAFGIGALHSTTTPSDNTALGSYALYSNTVGAHNTAVGSEALRSNTTGINNTAVGSKALFGNTTGYRNVAIGYGTLFSNIGGFDNIAIGESALTSNTNGTLNFAAGYESLYTNTLGVGNAAIGMATLRYNTSGANNFAVGSNALYYNSTGSDNIAIGTYALEGLGISYGATNNNIALGRETLRHARLGGNNTAMGFRALTTNENGDSNIAIGYQALTANLNGLNNFAAGWNALASNVNAERNIAIGYQTLRNNTSGQSNIALGHNALYGNTTAHYNIALGEDAMGAVYTGGPRNVMIGFDAGYQHRGTDNIGIGDRAVYGVAGGSETGANNIGIGKQALTALSSGTDNIAVGRDSLKALTSGYENIALGAQALASVTTGTNNIAVGAAAGQFTTLGLHNIALGYYTLNANKTGQSNVSVGSFSMQEMRDGLYNVAVGESALYASGTPLAATTVVAGKWYTIVTSGTTNYVALGAANNNPGTTFQSTGTGTGTGTVSIRVSNNTAVGQNALYGNQTGSDNTAVGNNAGRLNNTGSGNVFIGYSAGYNETGSNKLYIANSNTATPLIHGDFSTSALTVNGRLRAKTAYSDTTVLTISTGTVAVDASLSNNFEITANANFTLSNPTNLVKGMIINFEIIQDATGSRLITYGSMYKFAISSDKSLSTPANSRDFMSCYYNGTNLICNLGKGYQ